MALFAKDGFDGVSIRQIAASVGVTLATLYHYYADKQALYDAAVREAFGYVRNRMLEAVNTGLKGEARLRAFLRAMVTSQMSDAPEVRLVDREILEAQPETIAMLSRELFQEPHDALTSIVRDLAPNAPAHDIAEFIIGASFGAVRLRVVRIYIKDIDHLQTIDGVVNSLTENILALMRGYALGSPSRA